MREGIAQLAELHPNCFRQPGQPLKIGIHNDIIALHPELQPGLIASALKMYTRSLGYLEMLRAGTARIDLEGNPVGTVTAADEEDPAQDRQGGQTRRGYGERGRQVSRPAVGKTCCETCRTTKPHLGGKLSTADAGSTTTSRVS